MLRCIELAKKGLGTTYPNPLVGSVIVHNKKIIGEGWHYRAGEPHAEVMAIESVSDKSLLKDSTMYVNLEPCSHFGRTPPCANRIAAEGIPKVVIGSTDPNPAVSGNGIRKLEELGCMVKLDIMKEQCDELNKRFFTIQTKKRPYVILKWAQSTDGFIAPAKREEQAPVWISNKYSRQMAHKLRAEEMAILVGTQTVLDDDPSLTTRDWEGTSPVRIALDRSNKIPPTARILDGSIPTMIFSEVTLEDKENVSYHKIDFEASVGQQVCDLLYQNEIQSLVVEGGARTIQTFVEENLWDEAYVFEGDVTLLSGVPAPKFNAEIDSEIKIKNDTLIIYKNHSK